MNKPQSLDLENNDFSLRISCKAPPFLDKKGVKLANDEVAASWGGVIEAFSRIHGQRVLEVMDRIFKEMPEGERIWLEWEEDEGAIFYLRFSNGWSIDNWTVSPDVANSGRHERPSDAIAPDWFPRGRGGLRRWKHWHNLLHNWSISPEVDGLANQRLHGAVPKDGLYRGSMPDLEEAVLGPQWCAAIEHVKINLSTPNEPARKFKPGGRL